MNDRLYRSRDDRMLAGVAGGLAEYWDADPSLIRVVWALLVLVTGGLALAAYIIMAFVVPDADEASYVAPPPPVVPGPATGHAPPLAIPTGAGSAPTSYRMERRAARRAAREARRAYHREHGGGLGVLLAGSFLVLLGAYFLAGEWLPQLDLDRLWPLILIALGVIIIAVALNRTRGDGPAAR